jgi:AcrR family transcriptional regulator
MPRRPRSSSQSGAEPASAAQDPRSRIVDALMALAAERRWEDISISDIARQASVSLAEFRDHFISKGAVLGAFSRRVDRIVLDGTTGDLDDEPAKERLFDVLMRRLDAMTPYKAAMQSIMEWAQREPLAAMALNRQAVNSMRFMLEAAGIDSEGPVGALKMQGLVFAWRRVLARWFSDDDAGLAPTMALLDRELTRGGRFVARANDLHRLASPLRSIARAVCRRRSRGFERARARWRGDDRDSDDAAEVVV